MIRSMRKLASEIAKREGKKSQARIGDIREILGHVSDLVYQDTGVSALLEANGFRRTGKIRDAVKILKRRYKRKPARKGK